MLLVSGRDQTHERLQSQSARITTYLLVLLSPSHLLELDRLALDLMEELHTWAQLGTTLIGSAEPDHFVPHLDLPYFSVY